jgi:hypothetical protein
MGDLQNANSPQRGNLRISLSALPTFPNLKKIQK